MAFGRRLDVGATSAVLAIELAACGGAGESIPTAPTSVGEPAKVPRSYYQAWMNIPCNQGQQSHLEVIPELNTMVASCAIRGMGKQTGITSTADHVTISTSKIPFKHTNNMYWLGFPASNYVMSQESGVAVISPSAKVQDIGNWLMQVQSIGDGKLVNPTDDPANKAKVILQTATSG